jgi:hypothetical protein
MTLLLWQCLLWPPSLDMRVGLLGLNRYASWMIYMTIIVAGTRLGSIIRAVNIARPAFLVPVCFACLVDSITVYLL